MSINRYFKERLPFLIFNAVLCIIVSATMIIAGFYYFAVVSLVCAWFIPLITYMIYQCLKFKRYFDNIVAVSEDLDRKYLLPEVIDEEEFMEAEVICSILRNADKSMHEEVKIYENEQKDYKEYIETWIHEIKTPISSIELIVANGDDNPYNSKISYEIKRIERYVEQVLYYAKSSDTEKDYVVRKFDLRSAVMKCIKTNSLYFINKRIKLDLGEISEQIYSDEKWIIFIINQILVNAVKYSHEDDGIIKIYSHKKKDSVELIIEDNGIGINEKDIDRVFEKGFTGDNGRKTGKSTGIGLYLCRKLCDKLGLNIMISSEENRGTRVVVIFPKSCLIDEIFS